MNSSNTYKDEEQLPFSIGEVAKIARVTVPTVRNWDKPGGKLRSFRTPGGQRRFAHSDVARLFPWYFSSDSAGSDSSESGSAEFSALTQNPAA